MALRVVLAGLQAARGQYASRLESEVAAIAEGMRTAVDKGSRTLQLAARQEVNTRFIGSERVSGGSRRVGNSIRRKLYFDDRPFKAAATVFSKFGKRGQGGAFIDYLAPYVFGATIRPKRAKFLFIPASRKRGVRARLSRNKREFGQRSGRNTEVVPTKKPGVFVVVRKTKSRTTLIGWLVRRVIIRPRLNFQAIVQRQVERFPQSVNREIERAAERRIKGGAAGIQNVRIGGLGLGR